MSKEQTQDIPDLIAGALGVSRGTAYDMMREALAEAQPLAGGCDYCNHPLYAGTKCENCGNIKGPATKERKHMSELRKEVETELGVTPAKPAKVGRRIPTFEIHEAPSHWRKTLKAWGILFLGIFVVSLLSGIVVGLFHRV